MKKVSISITLTEDLLKYVKERAEQTSSNVSTYIRQLILSDKQSNNNGEKQ